MDSIEIIQPDIIKTIDVKTETNLVPKRITIEYELATEIKDISKEIEDNSK